MLPNRWAFRRRHRGLPNYVAFMQHIASCVNIMLRRSKNHLHAATAKAILQIADALRRTAFLDVSSLNFGGATSTAVFLFGAMLYPAGAHLVPRSVHTGGFEGHYVFRFREIGLNGRAVVVSRLGVSPFARSADVRPASPAAEVGRPRRPSVVALPGSGADRTSRP